MGHALYKPKQLLKKSANGKIFHLSVRSISIEKKLIKKGRKEDLLHNSPQNNEMIK